MRGEEWWEGRAWGVIGRERGSLYKSFIGREESTMLIRRPVVMIRWGCLEAGHGRKSDILVVDRINIKDHDRRDDSGQLGSG